MASSYSLLAAVLFLLAAAFSCHCNVAAAKKGHGQKGHGKRAHGLGVNYGTLGDNLPTPTRSVRLLRDAGAGAVKIYDANPEILSAFAGTGIPVSAMVPNEIIPSIAASRAAAHKWVVNNLPKPSSHGPKIVYLLVGNELLSNQAIKDSTWGAIVPAMRNLRHALRKHGMGRVKLGTPLAMDALSASYPPSSSLFRDDIELKVMRPLLRFLNLTKSYYFVDAYPYFAWAGNQDTISLDYALFQGKSGAFHVDPQTGLKYTNLLDQMLDACVAAMAKLGFGKIKMAIAETGWPNGGGPGASVGNAAIYNRNLAARMATSPGTPLRPGEKMPVFVFSLYNEDKKPGAGTERHWGLFYPNGTAVYQVDLGGRRRSYPPLPSPPPSPSPSTPPSPPAEQGLWCVLLPGKDEKAVAAALNYACGQGSGTCAAIQPGAVCFEPNTLDAHASYAFNSYWQQFRKSGASCSFNGLATTTTTDPSHGSCKFPSSPATPPPPPPPPVELGVWCVLAPGKDEKAVEAALNYACGQGQGTCAAIQPGGACFEPNTLDAHASYAFNSYWQQFRKTGGSCSFNGLAVTTTADPSHGSCKFPSSSN
ncbi:probable glucan endo-1,3-beta-glucosidase A6 [Brachypodium distachyon]|uniref:glucan endo-1,3-beta-D-glucosidase n=1 Tax=Brachypodium distachyon TaxID=15368 RepID=I1I8T4_BRADI|nr:probable glucan endo-1,3-beta-glucosidase A6 [Brachypodium distachyon]PNT68470.1 hypothetical protein BRADI_3g40907v3 [Brachypodium distachyon]|eukprot:XP_003572424.1 probable glucan endo-1,3-beta-glucosidase A6 [Brachypodium distachyon]